MGSAGVRVSSARLCSLVVCLVYMPAEVQYVTMYHARHILCQGHHMQQLPGVQEQQARVAQFDQAANDAPETGNQGRQEGWSGSSSASTQQQDSVSSQGNANRSQQQQIQQEQQQTRASDYYQQPRQQNARTQKSWGSDIDLGSLDDWDSD